MFLPLMDTWKHLCLDSPVDAGWQVWNHWHPTPMHISEVSQIWVSFH